MQPRKGWDVLLEAYLSEFTQEDNVELYILTKPFGGSGDAVRLASAASLCPVWCLTTESAPSWSTLLEYTKSAPGLAKHVENYSFTHKHTAVL